MKAVFKFIVFTFSFLFPLVTVFCQQDSGNPVILNEKENEPIYYLGLIKQGYSSGALYFNAGNAYFNKKDMPHAILYYEKALRISPLDRDILYNLSVARRQVDSEIMPIPDFFLFIWWRNFVSIFSADIWAYLSLFFGVLVVVFTGYRWLKNPGFSTIWIWIVLFIFFITLPASFYRYRIVYSEMAGILMTKENLYPAPDERSGKLYELIAGEKLKITDSVGKWYHVRLINREKGWILKDKIEKI